MSRSSIESAASNWIARRDAGLTSAEQAEFEKWYSDVRHAEAFARHELTWKIFSRPGALGKGYEMIQEMNRRIARRNSRRKFLAGTVAAMFLVTIVAWRFYAPRDSVALISIPATAHVVRQERQTLSDGTVVELKSGAEVRTEFSENFRRVALVKGEAHFHVTKNKDRPFVVAVGHVEVRAVGTAFSVQREEGQLEVLVTEGIVAVDQRADVSALLGAPPAPTTTAQSPTLATLKVGDRAVIDFSKEKLELSVESLDSASMASRLAWRTPRLEFTGTPLSEAVSLINGFSQVKIGLGDPSLAALEVSGFIRADNTDSFLRMIQDSFEVRAEQKGDTILLYKAL